MSSRLGDTPSPEWDHSSPKIEIPSLDENSSRGHQVFFENSLGRVTLAWARQRVAQKKSPPPGRAARTKPRRVSSILA